MTIEQSLKNMSARIERIMQDIHYLAESQRGAQPWEETARQLFLRGCWNEVVGNSMPLGATDEQCDELLVQECIRGAKVFHAALEAERLKDAVESEAVEGVSIQEYSHD